MRGVCEDRRGVILEEVLIKTLERNPASFLDGLKGKVMVHLEECDMAGWLASVLDPRAEDVVVSDLRHNHLIHKFGSEAYLEDARKLAELLRLGGYRLVHHPTDTRVVYFSALVKEQLSLTRRIADQKSRTRAALRREGVVMDGTRLRSRCRREETLSLLPSPLALVLSSELPVLDT